jgi:hypothetical protein
MATHGFRLVAGIIMAMVWALASGARAEAPAPTASTTASSSTVAVGGRLGVNASFVGFPMVSVR